MKKHAVVAACCCLALAHAQASDPIGIVGGWSYAFPYAALVQPGGAQLPLSPLPAGVFITSVSMNPSGNSIIGGYNDAGQTYAAFVSALGIVTPITPSNNQINVVAINALGNALIGGCSNTGGGYAALVSSSGIVSDLPISGDPLPAIGSIYAIALNDLNASIIGGENGAGAYAALVSASGNVTNLPNGPTSLPTTGSICSVSINPSGNGIIGGENSTDAYAALVSSSGSVSNLPTGPGALPSPGNITSVAINSLGNSIIGGQANAMGGYAALVSSSGTITNLPTGPGALPLQGSICSVAINSTGQAIIGGQEGTAPYAAFVSPSGSITNLGPFPSVPYESNISSVAIDQFGSALIGGGGMQGYAALVTPSGSLIPLSIPQNGFYIQSVSLITALSQIPTTGLGGNVLKLANYINKYAPEKAFYFLPAYADGTLQNALESALPTRNAASLQTSINSLSSMIDMMSLHLREQRHFLTKRRQPPSAAQLALHKIEAAELSASLGWQLMKSRTDNNQDGSPKISTKTSETRSNSKGPFHSTQMKKTPPFDIWVSAIGNIAHQKAEHQTPGFNPKTAGSILAFEKNLSEYARLGLGGAYSYSHIQQHQHSGHAHIQQEYLFLYRSWGSKHFYLDASVWGALFQVRQVRNVEMTGFSFRSTSKAHGSLVAPQIEIGLDYNLISDWFSLQPFAASQWISQWQKRYEEKGNSPLNIGQKNHHGSFLRNEIGLRFFETVHFDTWDLVFQEKTSFVNKKPYGIGRMNAFIVGSPGSFTVETLSTPQNTGIAQFSMIFSPINVKYPWGFISYQGEWSRSYQSQQLLLELCWNF